ncbi:hypothetical protein JRO89_XS02G0290300 [Xanthoceras sorbifolium]|uniref:Uncharacterized protein n=1 Tax=Xanthoceras sorbifolium TaxID=99658 RepID=A0ABQ8IHF5_9ROSI|nr:hypothetical protein JRO89_XS02G0290300 [Xanthoceras sorbifolium]
MLLSIWLQEMYKNFRARLPVVAAETIFCTDPKIKLTLWSVHMFKDLGKDWPRIYGVRVTLYITLWFPYTEIEQPCQGIIELREVT